MDEMDFEEMHPEQIRDVIETAIELQNLESIPALLKLNSNEEICDFEYHLYYAIKTGNITIIKLVMDAWPLNKPKVIHHLLCYLPENQYDENQKMEILQYLLPHIHRKHSTIPDFPPIGESFHIILCCCAENNFILAEFFIKNLYTEQHNSLYPLIKKLEAAIDDWHHIGAFLHDDLDRSDYRQTMASIFGEDRQFGNVVGTFLKILMKDTRESMELAIEIFQVFLDKNYHRLFPKYFKWVDSYIIRDIEQVLKVPFKPKILFKFIYTAINGKTQPKIYEIIDSWLCQRNNTQKHYLQSFQLLNSFISKPLREIATPEPQSDDAQSISRQENVFSLKELSRDVIRYKVFQYETNVKEFMDRIWEMKLPVTLKCFLLYIPDPAWMDDLQMS